MKKINVFRIITEHISTLRDYRTGRISPGDLVVFFFVPLLLGAAALYVGMRFNYDVLNAFLMAFSIFAGLLLNLLILVLSFSERAEHGTILQGARKQLLRELHTNISFAILVSIGVVVTSIVEVANLRLPSSTVAFTGHTVTYFLTFLIANFVLTLLMILKRMHILLSQALKEASFKKSA